jgi:hypothetical protein
MDHSSNYKSLFYVLDLTYELEYSPDHVLELVYELVYSLHIIILTCSYLFFIDHHMTDMIRGGVTVRCAFRFVLVLVRPFVGWGSWGDKNSALICGHGARVLRHLRI